jgi:hypothetical protein
MVLIFKLLLLAVAAYLFFSALARQWGGSARRQRLRAAFLDECKTVFEGGTKAISPTGFPRITGTYRGHTFDLQVSPDTLNYRKLPALWLLVSLVEPQPVRATFDLMLRPRGIEGFSNFATLPQQIDIPPGFPADCAIRTDDPGGLPDLTLLRRHLTLIARDRAKELIIAPKGLRLVWLAEEAQRTTYLLFRDSEMGLTPFAGALLRPLLDGLIDLHDDLANTSTGPAP